MLDSEDLEEQVEVEIIIDRGVLENINGTTLLNAFLAYWLSEHKTKAIVPLKAWNEFFKDQEKALKDYDEVRKCYFATIRGFASPYRNKYAPEGYEITDKEQENPVDEIVRIAKMHYATVKYIIVTNPNLYIGKDVIKEKVMTIQQFFNKLEVEDNVFVQEFIKKSKED